MLPRFHDRRQKTRAQGSASNVLPLPPSKRFRGSEDEAQAYPEAKPKKQARLKAGATREQLEQLRERLNKEAEGA